MGRQGEGRDGREANGRGRSLPLYQALLECGFRDGARLLPGTDASIWHAIDQARAGRGARAEIPILEEIAVQVHLLKQRLDRHDRVGESDLAPRLRIAELTRQWVEVAPLRA